MALPAMTATAPQARPPIKIVSRPLLYIRNPERLFSHG